MWAEKFSAVFHCFTLSLTQCPMVLFAAAFPPLLTHFCCSHSKSLFHPVTEAKASRFARTLWNTWKSLSACTSEQSWIARSCSSPVRFSPKALLLLSCPLSCWGLRVSCKRASEKGKGCFDSDTTSYILLTTLRSHVNGFTTSRQSKQEKKPNLLKAPLFNFQITSGVK